MNNQVQFKLTRQKRTVKVVKTVDMKDKEIYCRTFTTTEQAKRDYIEVQEIILDRSVETLCK